MLRVLLLAALVGIGVVLACLLVGPLLLAIDVALSIAVGTFLVKFATGLGIIAGLWFAASRWPR